MADNSPRRPYPGQQWKHGWIPVTATATASKKKAGNPDAIKARLAEAREAALAKSTPSSTSAPWAKGLGAGVSKPKGEAKGSAKKGSASAKSSTKADPAATSAALDDAKKAIAAGRPGAAVNALTRAMRTASKDEKPAISKLRSQVAANVKKAEAPKPKQEDDRAPGMQQGLRHRDNDEALAWAKTNLPLPDLTEDEKASVKKYTGGSIDSYEMINKGLRGEILPSSPDLREKYENHVRNIDSAFEKSVLPESIAVHRAMSEGFSKLIGVNSSDIDGMHALVGKEFVEKGYLSTSIGAKAADFDGPFYMMLRVPKGHKALNVMPVSAFEEDEREILIDRDTKFVFHGVSGRKNDAGQQEWFLEAEVVPADWEKPAGWKPTPYNDLPEAYGK